MAGSLRYDGPIIMQGSITSPSWTREFQTNIHLTKGDFKFVDPVENKYKIDNGARIVDNGNIVVGNILAESLEKILMVKLEFIKFKNIELFVSAPKWKNCC